MASPAVPPAAVPPSAAPAEGRQEDKVVVFFRATGDAPLLKRSKFKIGANERFAKVVDFLRKQIQRDTVVRG